MCLYQTQRLLTSLLYQSIGTSETIIQNIDGLNKLRKEVKLSNATIKILDVAQDEGAPQDGSTKNCLEMQKLVLGEYQTYSINLQWNSVNKAFKLVLNKSSGCNNALSNQDQEDLSLPIYHKIPGQDFFHGVGTSEDSGYKEVNFNFSTKYGNGIMASGLNNTSVQISIKNVTPHECRVASPDSSWFTDFGVNNKIRTVTVSITQNFEQAIDRLRFEAAPQYLTVTTFDDIGVLHLNAKDGLTTSEWLSLLVNVKYTTNIGSVVTEGTLPKRITFVLGDGLSYSPSGAPSNHFYFALKLENELDFNSADLKANSYCYPGFTNDTGLLGLTRNGPNQSCSDANIASKRLTGHLLTVSTEGEQSFINQKVLKMIYQANDNSSGLSGLFNLNGVNERNANLGNTWLGGVMIGQDSDENKCEKKYWWGSELNYIRGYRWIRGYEKWPGDSCRSHFAESDLTPLFMYAAPYFNSLPYENANIFTNISYPISMNLAPNQDQKYWNTSNSYASHLIVEFGDNYGLKNIDQESSVNNGLKLKKDVQIIPFELLKTCKQ